MKKDWRERELTMEILVGSFMVMIFLGLGYFTIILSKEALFRKTTQIQVTFSNVMGLRVGDVVSVRGMPVGKVKTLELAGDADCAGVCVTLMLDKPITLRAGYSFRILTTSILGGRQLQIYEGPPDAPELVLDRYRGKDPYDVIADAAEIVNAARNQIIEGKVFENIRDVIDKVNAMVTRVNAGKGMLGRLLSEDDTMYSDLAMSAASLREIMTRLADGESSIGKLLAADDSLYNDLAAAVGSIKTIAGRLEAGEGSLGKLLSEDDSVYQDIAQITGSLKDVAARIAQGEGTLGRFIADDSLYNEIEASISEIRAAVDDFREAAPITTFSSIFFGAF